MTLVTLTFDAPGCPFNTQIESNDLSSMGHMTGDFDPSDDPDNKVHGAKMGPIWGRQDPCGPHVGPMNFAIWGVILQWIVCFW